jgi:hypothetical protein
MKFLKILSMIIFSILFVFIAGGFLLPSKWQLTYSATVRHSPEQIYNQVANLKHWQNWSVWKDSEYQMTSSYSGPDKGVGAGWDWISKDMGNGSIHITEAEAAQRIQYDLVIDMNGQVNKMTGEITLEPVNHGTLVTWTDRGDAGNNFAQKWLAQIIKVMVKGQMSKSLVQLNDLNLN